MSQELMTKQQMAAMLENLPAACVFDAIDGLKPAVSVGVARHVLHNLETENIINWRRDSPQTISLSDKGKEFLACLK